MAFHCSKCTRKLLDASDPSDPPLFCMYCGHRLVPKSPPVTVTHEPQLSDSRTSAFVANPEPELATTAFPEASATPTEKTPNTVAGFELVRLLGAGGMGQVYEAVNPGNGQRVAIKLLSRRLAASSSSVERFRQEGRVASQITHPHCVFVLRADTDAGRPYIMMELMPGRTLKDLVDDQGPLSVPEAIRRILEVIDGLSEAHELGVIHRDVKPSNCFLTADDRVKVGDFGLSKSLSSEQPNQQLTQSGAFLGTVLFASPEQIRGEPVGYDSDVYSVCATLYYLLMGRAPFQHESLTASLAKAVSEAAPPMRPQRPDIPSSLERIILKGLDRDRTKRYPTLAELRHALDDIRPERQLPARPRVLMFAYFLDALILTVACISLEVLLSLVIQGEFTGIHVGVDNWHTLVITLFYFTLFEGLIGWTPGKRLLRLRVVRSEQLAPPGWLPALIRSVVFNTLWLGLLGVPELFVQYWPGGVAGGFLGTVAVILSLVGLLSQLKRGSQGWRGLHDRISGCRVVAPPFTPPPATLESLYPTQIWEKVQPSAAPLPRQVGAFQVQHQLASLADGGLVWQAEDKALARRVLLHILPAGAEDPIRGEAPLIRSHRLRIVGHGLTLWEGERRAWVGYVAPAGVPLADCVSPEEPVSWPTARRLLEQLALELESSQEEGALATPLSIHQVWVEPNGRLQWLDFPLAGTAPPQPVQPVDDPIRLLQQTATLALEGRARDSSDPVAAPIPPHATALMAKLFQPETRLADIRNQLAEDHHQPATLTVGMRAAHLTLQAGMLAIGLLLMFGLSGLMSLMLAINHVKIMSDHLLLLNVLNHPEEGSRLVEMVEKSALYKQTKETILERIGDNQRNATIDGLNRRMQHLREDNEQFERALVVPERKLLRYFSRIQDKLYTTVAAEEVNLWMLPLTLQTEEHGAGLEASRRRQTMGKFILKMIGFWLFIWTSFALVFRGGLSYSIAGLTIVRRSGRPLGRIWCAVRELLVWAPIAGILALVLWIQMFYPYLAQTRSIIWVFAILLLPVYVMIAIRQLNQPPQDRLLGSYLVPR